MRLHFIDYCIIVAGFAAAFGSGFIFSGKSAAILKPVFSDGRTSEGCSPHLLTQPIKRLLPLVTRKIARRCRSQLSRSRWSLVPRQS